MKKFISKIAAVLIIMTLTLAVFAGAGCKKNRNDSTSDTSGSSSSTSTQSNSGSQGGNSGTQSGNSGTQGSGTQSGNSGTQGSGTQSGNTGSQGGTNDGEYTQAELDAIITALEAREGGSVALDFDGTFITTSVYPNQSYYCNKETEKSVIDASAVFNANGDFDFYGVNTSVDETLNWENQTSTSNYIGREFTAGRNGKILDFEGDAIDENDDVDLLDNINSMSELSKVDWSNALFYSLDDSLAESPLPYILPYNNMVLAKLNGILLSLGQATGTLTHENNVATLDLNLTLYNLFNEISILADNLQENTTLGDLLRGNMRKYLECIANVFTAEEISGLLGSLLGTEIEPAENATAYDYLLQLLDDETITAMVSELTSGALDGKLSELTVGKLLSMIPDAGQNFAETKKMITDTLNGMKEYITKTEFKVGDQFSLSDAYMVYNFNGNNLTSQSFSLKVNTHSKSSSYGDNGEQETITHDSQNEMKGTLTYSNSAATLIDISAGKVESRRYEVTTNTVEFNMSATVVQEKEASGSQEETWTIKVSVGINSYGEAEQIESITINDTPCDVLGYDYGDFDVRYTKDTKQYDFKVYFGRDYSDESTTNPLNLRCYFYGYNGEFYFDVKSGDSQEIGSFIHEQIAVSEFIK